MNKFSEMKKLIKELFFSFSMDLKVEIMTKCGGPTSI